MHELPITQRITQMALRCVSDAQAQPDTDFFLVLNLRCPSQGRASEMRWAVVRRGALANEARRYFERALFKLKCSECGIVFDLTESAPICPLCGGLAAPAVEADGCGVEVAETG